MTIVRETARAKVNLTLRILGRRPDGYHELESLVAFADLADGVTVENTLLSGSQATALAVSGPFAAAITGTNLISRAVEMAAKANPALAATAIRVDLDKQIPVAAGLGGGSADAAAVLRALRSVPPQVAGIDWVALAQRLGADVPVCLAQRSAVMRGIGEIMTPCRVPRFAAVLANPNVDVPADKTRRVFHALAAPPLLQETSTGSLAGPRADFLSGPLSSVDDLVSLMRNVGNDLEAPALRVIPAIAEVEAALQAAPGCLKAQLSGAGPTCFGVFATTEDATRAATALGAQHPGWWITQTMIGD